MGVHICIGRYWELQVRKLYRGNASHAVAEILLIDPNHYCGSVLNRCFGRLMVDRVMQYIATLMFNAVLL